jgi:hypothetical protein
VIGVVIVLVLVGFVVPGSTGGRHRREEDDE